MQVERRGGPPDLQTTFAHFVARELRGRLLDDRNDEEAKLGKFPDFACFRDLVLIEMKHLESEQNERVNETYKKQVLPEEEPIFYGTRRVDFAYCIIEQPQACACLFLARLRPIAFDKS